MVGFSGGPKCKTYMKLMSERVVIYACGNHNMNAGSLFKYT